MKYQIEIYFISWWFFLKRDITETKHFLKTSEHIWVFKFTSSLLSSSILCNFDVKYKIVIAKSCFLKEFKILKSKIDNYIIDFIVDSCSGRKFNEKINLLTNWFRVGTWRLKLCAIRICPYISKSCYVVYMPSHNSIYF